MVKWPKIKLRRADMERVLIASSAVLVLFLSVSSQRTDAEPYEERLEEIPQAQQTGAVQPVQAMQQTVVYYEDGDGYLVPVQRDVARQEGIAKATLQMMVSSAKNDMDAARLGLIPVVPEGTTFDLDISQGHARVDMSAHVLAAADKQQEENLRTAIVWALTEFDTVKDVGFLVDGRERETLTHGTNISGSYTRVGLNQEKTQDVFAGGSTVQMYFPAQDGRLLVPVSRTVYASDDIATAVFEFLRGPKEDSGLNAPLPQDTQLLGVEVEDGVVTIRFSEEFTQIAEHSDGGVQAMRALMMTCTRYPGVKKVNILAGGKPYDIPAKSAAAFANIASEVEASYPEVMLIE